MYNNTKRDDLEEKTRIVLLKPSLVQYLCIVWSYCTCLCLCCVSILITICNIHLSRTLLFLFSWNFFHPVLYEREEVQYVESISVFFFKELIIKKLMHSLVVSPLVLYLVSIFGDGRYSCHGGLLGFARPATVTTSGYIGVGYLNKYQPHTRRTLAIINKTQS